MSDIAKNLEEQANLLFENVAGWDTKALQRIGKRIKSIEKMSMADLQGINNAVWVRQDFDAIMQELATVMEMSASEVEDIYSNMVDEQHEADRPLYDYRNKEFKPLSDNRRMKAMVRAFSKATAKSMIGLSGTKATGIGFVDKNNKFVSFEKDYKKVLDKAIMSITTGTGDFHSEMREVLKELGGSGLRVDYGGGVTRRLDSMVRQNLLFGAKQASVEYSEMIGEELGCDGIEIDWHSNPRPAHEFMQGKQFSLHGKKTIKGVTYEDAGKALKALSDYGCLHFKTPIILGVSRPRFDPEELERLNRENSKIIEIDGVKKTGYGWKQTMRRLETEARKTRDQIEILKASGDKEGVKQLLGRLKAINEKYATVAKATGIKPQYEKMAIMKGKTVDKGGGNDIIDSYKGRGLSIEENNAVRVTEETSERVVEATKKITSDFKVIETSCEPIKYGRVDGSPAQCVYSPGTGKITVTLRDADFSNPVKLLERLKGDYVAGVSYDTDRIESLVAHELGHCAHDLLTLKRCGLEYGKPLTVLQREIFKHTQLEIAKEIYEVAFSKETKEDIWSLCEEELGSMSIAPRELIAQSFGNYYYGSKKSKVAKKIVEYFIKELR